MRNKTFLKFSFFFLEGTKAPGVSISLLRPLCGGVQCADGSCFWAPKKIQTANAWGSGEEERGLGGSREVADCSSIPHGTGAHCGAAWQERGATITTGKSR